MHHRGWLGILAFAIAILSGCGGPMVRSSSILSDAGFAYYLPKQLIKIEVDHTELPTKLGEKLAKAREALEAAKAEANTASDKVDKLTELRDATVAGSPAREKLELDVQLAEADQITLVKAVGKAQANVDTLLALLTMYQSHNLEQPRLVTAIKVTLLPPMADTETRYVAMLPKRAMRSDDFTLKSTTAGLLTTGDVTSTDHTAEVLVEWISSLGDLAGISAAWRSTDTSIRARGSTPEKPPQAQCKPFHYEAVIDPLDVDELRDANKQIANLPCKSNIRLVLAKHQQTPAPETATAPECQIASCEQRIRKLEVRASRADEVDAIMSAQIGELSHQVKSVARQITALSSGERRALEKAAAGGVFYRRKVPHVLNVLVDERQVQSIVLEIPNGQLPALLPLEGVALAQADHDFVLENGMLTEHHAVRPSSALAIAKVPGAIAREIISIPARIIQLRIDQTNKQKDLTTSQLGLLQEIAKLEAELATARGAPTPESP